ncbi:MAG: DUF1775 domain-containing protein [Alphaproteobacteria bacterium]|nr:DUF1775 domain-containing protein [Alphaproteobacteria bacterium]
MRRTAFSAAALLVFTASTASAHVTLEVAQAAVGSHYKAILRVPHGCEGSTTLKVRVQVPEGVINVKPMPKPGWTIETVKGKYAKAYDYYGTALDQGVTEISWSGSLPDEYYDEFVLRGMLANELTAHSTLYFLVVQECENGVERWIEIPEPGKTADDYEAPAPALKLLPKE